jgi:hypothetical protein
MVDSNSTTARIGDGNADADGKNGAVKADGAITVYSSVTSSPYVGASSSTSTRPEDSKSKTPPSENKFSGSLGVTVGRVKNEAQAFINSDASVDAGGALTVQAETLNDWAMTGYVNIVEPWLEKPAYTTEESDPNVTVANGDIVEVHANHTGGGEVGLWYEYTGSTPNRNINLLTEDFSDTSLWESHNQWVRKIEGSWRNLSTYINGDLGISNWFANDWTSATASGDKLALAGAVTFLDLTNVAEAYIKSGAKLNQILDTGSQNVSVLSTNDNQAVHFVGNFSLPDFSIPNIVGAGKKLVNSKGAEWKAVLKENTLDKLLPVSGKKGAVGVTFGMFMYNDTTTARIEDGVLLHADSLNVDAATDVMAFSVGASGGQSDNIAVNGAVFVNVINDHTIAQIENGAVVTVGSALALDPTDPATDPSANGSLRVEATNNIFAIAAAGGIAA